MPMTSSGAPISDEAAAAARQLAFGSSMAMLPGLPTRNPRYAGAGRRSPLARRTTNAATQIADSSR